MCLTSAGQKDSYTTFFLSMLFQRAGSEDVYNNCLLHDCGGQNNLSNLFPGWFPERDSSLKDPIIFHILYE